MRHKEREISNRSELLQIIDRADVCRIGLNTGTAPYIVPLNFGYRWDNRLEFYFHCAAEGRKVDLINNDNKAGFEIDIDHELVAGIKACNWGMRYKSIIGSGIITEITDDGKKAEALDLIMNHYGSGNGKHHYDKSDLNRTKILKLEAVEISGKKREDN